MVSLGEELKRERELRDISLREISEATRISIRILEAIETDNYKLLPGGIFNRNFLRAYADFIGIDPEKVVRKYQIQNAGAEDPGVLYEIINQGKEKEAPKKISGKTILLFLVLLTLALLAFFLIWNKSNLLRPSRSKPAMNIYDDAVSPLAQNL
jgi:cytoskeleton protein RodZ